MTTSGSAEQLAKLSSGIVAKRTQPLTIGALEHALLERYPRADAEEWDRMGLLAGDPSALVSNVLVALDPTVQVLEAAKQLKANVVLTHHPVFLEPPTEFLPLGATHELSGTLVASALQEGIALMNIHTALDASAEANRLLPSLLSLRALRPLLPIDSEPQKGYGQICEPNDETFKLSQLAARCLSVFGATPRVWGPANADIRSIAVMNGSAGSAVQTCLDEHIDCLICGELHYHTALEAAQKGLALIELGHDVSELPLTALLAQAVAQIGVPTDQVYVFDQTPNWHVPDATRM